ncbi:peptide/nickel transport system permease protein/peptide/nickel transport system substrate-binding protein [Saccharopolyspora shandongensis]|uniref:Peptide/nickel transport system permease protein/peptide/nickel transport system substrate-binding protein n=1 Tax=Saccharopolyspora shandongensis TaxID=418495 RepID=A0A1H3KV84_9PSEU|nr:ABC transporter substrate-binding protein [Saccharopolyspora shandongensis]SDY55648.1 peptide/nickel transport system permease protein/peptide/nickel transport system substrate-binding protein [Saccharopolyspora shandongensis]
MKRIAAVVWVLLLALTACGSGAAEGGQHLRVAWRSNPSSLDPQRGNSGSDHAILYTMYDTLVSFDPKTLEPAPGLAESWNQDDPTALVLHLRPDVRFHDGTPVDAQAVKYNIERAKGPKSNIKSDVAAVTGVDVLDVRTVRLNLTRPDSSLLLTLADRAGMLVSPTAAEREGDAFERNPVGAGPWKFVEWRYGQLVRVERFLGYWQRGLPHLDSIDFTIMKDGSTAVNALRSGQQDMVFNPPPQDVGLLSAAKGTKVAAGPQLYQLIIYLDLSAPVFRDRRVREALNLALDREQILKVTQFGQGEPGWTPLPSDHWAFPKSAVPTYPHDPDRARRLLAEAGHADGLRFPLLTYPDPVNVRLAEVLKYQLGKVGVQIDLIPTELTQASSEFFNERKYPALLSAWTGRPDPGLTYKLMFTERGYYNAGHVATPGIDEALNAANGTADLAQRSEKLGAVARIVADQSLFVPLIFPDAVAAYREHVQGFEPNLLGKPKFTTVRIQR